MELEENDVFFDWDSEQMARIAKNKISGAVGDLDTKLMALAEK